MPGMPDDCCIQLLRNDRLAEEMAPKWNVGSFRVGWVEPIKQAMVDCKLASIDYFHQRLRTSDENFSRWHFVHVPSGMSFGVASSWSHDTSNCCHDTWVELLRELHWQTEWYKDCIWQQRTRAPRFPNCCCDSTRCTRCCRSPHLANGYTYRQHSRVASDCCRARWGQHFWATKKLVKVAAELTKFRSVVECECSRDKRWCPMGIMKLKFQICVYARFEAIFVEPPRYSQLSWRYLN